MDCTRQVVRLLETTRLMCEIAFSRHNISKHPRYHERCDYRPRYGPKEWVYWAYRKCDDWWCVFSAFPEECNVLWKQNQIIGNHALTYSYVADPKSAFRLNPRLPYFLLPCLRKAAQYDLNVESITQIVSLPQYTPYVLLLSFWERTAESSRKDIFMRAQRAEPNDATT